MIFPQAGEVIKVSLGAENVDFGVLFEKKTFSFHINEQH
jgi:hypothetical protein